jgi:SagB-type dehydrogenase family enzyme
MAQPTETATQLLHRLTSYRPDRPWDEPLDDERLVHGFRSTDLSTWPLQHKSYDGGLPALPLPRDLPVSAVPATRVLAGAETPQPVRIDLAALARLLYLTAGVVRVSERPDGRRILFRAAGSAGARFPLEFYVAVPDGTALPPGVHWYHPVDHALVRIGPTPAGSAPVLIVTGVPWRTGWRYRERGFRHIYWDAGTALAQFLALADSAGLTARLFTRFPDDRIAEVVGAELPHEFPLAVIALADGRPHIVATAPTAAGRIDHHPVEFPLVTEAQQAGVGSAYGPEWARGRAVPPAEAAPSLDEVIARRGSQRLMDPAGVVSRESLVASMAAAMRGVDLPHWIAANAVADLPPGLYRWPDLDTPVRLADLRLEMYRICLDQGLPADASYDVISAVDGATLDDRGYREAQFAAGLVEGRLHLMAYALGAAASGMTFYDSELGPFLGDDDLFGLLVTCVGVPEYAARRAGRPGRPTAVRGVAPRADDR